MTGAYINTAFARLDPGRFVWIEDRPLLGKLLELTTDSARVRIRHSVISHEEREYHPNQIRRADLSPQTRVYVADPHTGQLRAGRIINFDMALQDTHGRAYEVALPGSGPIVVPESELEVRCFEPGLDPTAGFCQNSDADRAEISLTPASVSTPQRPPRPMTSIGR